jgi:hypothetical protein
MVRGFFMIAAGLSGLIFGLKEIKLIQIPSSIDATAITNQLHHVLESIRSFFG